MAKIGIMAVLVIAGVLAFYVFSSNPHAASTGADKWGMQNQVNDKGYSQYLQTTDDFDFTNAEIQKVAAGIKDASPTADDAIKATLKFVVKNVKYDGGVSVSYCYNERASTVLSSGKGDCVSMSRLVAALLRAQGIPARTMGGCLSATQKCGILFAVVPGEEAKTAPLTEGDFKKRGFLHEWVEAWTPGSGWKLLEATAGQVYDLNCNTYLEFGYDSNQYDRCVINDNNFWNQCKIY